MSGGWVGSSATDRRSTLPPNWRSEIRPAVIKRDGGRCQWRDAPGTPICGAPGTDVDHIGDRNDHRLSQLRLLCYPHHARRSARQGNAARVSQRRPPERHPALG